jgi:hypothetical protein
VRVLVACEFSGVVRDAYTAAGHDAMSCDLLPTESPGPHYQGDVREILNDGWEMMIAHPPCTHLAWSANRWMKGERLELREQAIEFVRELLAAPIHRIALENPSGILTQRIRPPDCITQPYWHGHPVSKLTCFGLKNLPILQITTEVECLGTAHTRGSHRDRGKIRSVTFTGIAAAMAQQWPGPIVN